MNQTGTKALCDAFSFVAQTFANYRPEHCEQAMKQISIHYEVLKNLTNKDVANHFRDICITRMGDIMIQNDFKEESRIPDKYPKYNPEIHKTTLRLYQK